MDNKKAFTLIEIVVSVTIFVLMVTAASGLFVSGLKAQRQSLASQQLLDQTSYVLEYMSRALRMAKKELFNHAYSCLTTHGNNYENPAGNTSKIRFIKFNYEANQDFCHEFSLQNGILQEYKKNLETGEESTQPLISADLTIKSLYFNLAGHTQQDDLQPKITTFLDIEGQEQSGIKIQTTISQRNPDIRK